MKTSLGTLDRSGMQRKVMPPFSCGARVLIDTPQPKGRMPREFSSRRSDPGDLTPDPTRRELPPDVMKIYTIVVIDGSAYGLPMGMPGSPLKLAAPVQPTLRRLSPFDNIRFGRHQSF